MRKEFTAEVLSRVLSRFCRFHHVAVGFCHITAGVTARVRDGLFGPRGQEVLSYGGMTKPPLGHDKTLTKPMPVELRQQGVLSYCHATFLTRGISKPLLSPLSSKSRYDGTLYRVHDRNMTKTPLKGVFFLFKHITYLLYNNKIVLSVLSCIMYIPYFHVIVRMRARARARARETEVGR